jgi:hypothetical protein
MTPEESRKLEQLKRALKAKTHCFAVQKQTATGPKLILMRTMDHGPATTVLTRGSFQRFLTDVKRNTGLDDDDINAQYVPAIQAPAKKYRSDPSRMWWNND